jgi:hypothetical protein
MQYLCTCEHDVFADQDRHEGKKIVIMDDQWHKEALAVYGNWGISEITIDQGGAIQSRSTSLIRWL